MLHTLAKSYFYRPFISVLVKTYSWKHIWVIRLLDLVLKGQTCLTLDARREKDLWYLWEKCCLTANKKVCRREMFRLCCWNLRTGCSEIFKLFSKAIKHIDFQKKGQKHKENTKPDTKLKILGKWSPPSTVYSQWLHIKSKSLKMNLSNVLPSVARVSRGSTTSVAG